MYKNVTVRVWQSVNTSSPSTMWVLRLNSGSQAWYLYTLRHPASSRVSLKTKQQTHIYFTLRMHSCATACTLRSRQLMGVNSLVGTELR